MSGITSFERSVIQVKKIGTTNNLEGMLTKPIPLGKFDHCLKLLDLGDGEVEVVQAVGPKAYYSSFDDD